MSTKSKATITSEMHVARADRGPKSSEETTTRRIALYIFNTAKKRGIKPTAVAMPNDRKWGELSQGRSRHRAVLPTPSQVGLYFNHKRKKLTDNVLRIAWEEAQAYLKSHPNEFRA